MTICQICGLSYHTGDGSERIIICGSCRKTHVAKIIPPLFKLTDISRLPAKQYAEVMKWKYPDTLHETSGLLLHGPSGAGKTRCMWELLKGLGFFGEELAYFDGVSFGHELSRQYRNETAEDWLERLGTETKLVVFDDLGKLKLTDRVESELFGVIDRRCNNLLPIIATTQLGGSEIAGMMSEQRGGALVRRLRMACQLVEF